MTASQAIISGIVQGITEFFPISSSGHLAILHSLFGFKEPMLAFDVFLHFGTLVSIVIFFRKDIINILRKDSRLLKFIILGSIPTFIIGILFKDMVEPLFAAPRLVGYFLVLTGIFLLLASFSAMYWKMIRRSRPLGTINSLIIGIAQGISVLPGISRSGATIGTGLIAGLNEEVALKFSFLMALPAVLGANMLKAGQICGNLVSIGAVSFIAGGLAAMLTGFFAIKFLFVIVRKNMFFLFGVYCVLMGFASIILCN
jgi:undecaprenyl-diphosphatase